MAKEMVYFNATKQIETITIHYNNKLDGTFVDDVAKHIKDIAKKMGSKVNLKDPKEYYDIQVFVYPDKKMFNKVFGGEIEKRLYKRKTTTEDLYVVKDSDGNIHIVSPRGMNPEKKEALKKILVMKVLGEYMNEKEKTNAERLLKIAMQPKKEEIEEQEELEQDEESQEIDEVEEQEIEENEEELEQDEEIEEQEELSEEELNSLIAAEVVIEDIDKKEEEKEQVKEKISKSKEESRNWLNVGWFMYVKGRLKKQEDVKKFAEYVSANGVKKLSKLKNSRFMEDYDYSPEYACALVAFVVETYGEKKYVEFYNEPKDIKGVFGVPKCVFDAQFKAYVKEKYKSDENLQNIMEDKKIDEIVPVLEESKDKEQAKENAVDELTQIHFAKDGGVEISEPEVPENEERQISM